MLALVVHRVDDGPRDLAAHVEARLGQERLELPQGHHESCPCLAGAAKQAQGGYERV